MRFFIGYNEEKGYCIIPMSFFNKWDIPEDLQPIVVAVMNDEYKPKLERLVKDANKPIAESQRIAALEAEIAALKAERDALRGLLVEAAEGLCAFSTALSDKDVIKATESDEFARLYVRRNQYDFVMIEAFDKRGDDYLSVAHLRHAATIANEIRAKLDEQSK